MSSSERLRAVLAGVTAGLTGGLFGVGGGVIIIPQLTGHFGLTQHQAHGTSLAVMGVSALTGVLVYALHGQLVWSTAWITAAASVLTAGIGARWATRTSPLGLRRAFAVFMVIVALRLLWEVPEVTTPTFRGGIPGALFALVLGSAMGVLAGFMGVGGGILAVPAFTLLLGMPQQTAQGTSLAIIAVTGPAGALEHHRHGNVVWGLTPALAVGGLIGAALSSWVVHGIPHAALVRMFAIFLLANAVLAWGPRWLPWRQRVNGG